MQKWWANAREPLKIAKNLSWPHLFACIAADGIESGMPLILKIISSQNQTLGSDSSREFGPTGGSIGRLAGNDWVLPDPERFVSSQHAVIKFQDGDFYLTDTSTNGTFVNSGAAPVGNGTSVQLNPGDIVHIGDYDMEVTLDDAADNSMTGPVADPFAATGSQPVFESAIDPGQTLDPLAAIDAAEAAPTFDNTGPTGADPFAMPPPGSLEQESSGPLGDAFVAPAMHQEPRLGGGGIPEDWDKTSFEQPKADPFIQPPAADISQPAAGAGGIPEDWDKTSFESPKADPFAAQPAGYQQPAQLPPAQPTNTGPVDPLASGAWEQPAQPQQPVQQPPQQPMPGGIDPAATGTVQRPVLQPGAAPGGQSAGGGSGDLVQLLQNAGVDEATARQMATPQMAAVVGRLLPIFVSGMLDILQARSEIKSQFRMSMTRMQPVENNPLKFCADPQDAFFRLFMEQGSSFMPPDQAFTEGFDDIKAHQMAMMAGLRAAYDSMIESLDPDHMQDRFDRELRRSPMFKPLNKTKYWEMYGEMFEGLNRDADESFRRLFGDAFAKAYEDQMQRLQAMRR
jgi:type VI secretion system protein